MAKGKGKKVSSGGPHKKHGPKRHMFKEFKPMIHVFAKAGLLTKYNNFESWQLACAARGKKTADRGEFNSFVVLPIEQKKEYFKNLKK